MHLLIALFFVVSFKEIVFPPDSSKEQKISLNLSQFTPPSKPKPAALPLESTPVKSPLPQPVVKEIIKKVVSPAPIVKKKLLDTKKRLMVEKKESEENNLTKVEAKKEIVKRKVDQKPKKTVKKESKKSIVEPRKVQAKKQQKKSKDSLASALMGAGTSMYSESRPASSGYAAKMIKQLYGQEFNTFNSSQKKFIEDNLGSIHSITQRTLVQNGYPDVAVRTGQTGTNIVSFYLHPNGDITELKLKKHIGYAALDQNTLEVIHIAYKDYPRPSTKTKIVFYVQYSIY